MRLFYSFDTINWSRVSIITAAATVFWTGLVSIIPERLHHGGVVILGSFTAAITVLMRGGRSTIGEAVKDAAVEKLEGK